MRLFFAPRPDREARLLVVALHTFNFFALYPWHDTLFSKWCEPFGVVV